MSDYYNYTVAIRSLERAAEKTTRAVTQLTTTVQPVNGPDIELALRVRGLRRQEDAERLKRIKPWLRRITMDDLTCSTEPCCCGENHKKLKFKVEDKTYSGCPIDIGLAWLRLNLAMDFNIPVDMEKLLELARSMNENTL